MSFWVGGFVDDEGTLSEPVCVAQLNWQRSPQVTFEVVIPNGDSVDLEIRGASDVHLLGYFSPLEFGESDDEESGEVSEDSAELARLLYGLEDDDEDSNQSSDDEGESAAAKAALKKRKAPQIEELPSDDSSEEEKPAVATPSKKAAPTPAKAASPVSNQPPSKKQKTGEASSKPTAASPKPTPVAATQASPQGGEGKKKRKRNKNKGNKPQEN